MRLVHVEEQADRRIEEIEIAAVLPVGLYRARPLAMPSRPYMSQPSLRRREM